MKLCARLITNCVTAGIFALSPIMSLKSFSNFGMTVTIMKPVRPRATTRTTIGYVIAALTLLLIFCAFSRNSARRESETSSEPAASPARVILT